MKNNHEWMKYNNCLVYSKKFECFGRIFIKGPKSIHIKWNSGEVPKDKKREFKKCSHLTGLSFLNLDAHISYLKLKFNLDIIPKHIREWQDKLND